MATSTVAPPVSAPAAPTSSPAPAPVSTPASSTPTTPQTPSTPTAPPTPAEPLSLEQKISQGWEKAKADVAPEVTGEPAPAAPAVSPEDAAAALAAEQPALAEPAKEPTAATAEPPKPEFELNLDDADGVAPADFAKEVGKDPAVAKFFDDHPDLKNSVYAALRRDSENREIRQYVPDVETAKVVTKAAGAWQTIDNHFLGATSPEGANKFLDHWFKEAMIVDDKGQPVLDANGKYTVHPSLPYIIDHIFGNKLSYFGEQAKVSGNERLQAAVDIIREAITPSSPATGEVPDELKPFADSLKAKETALKEREQADERQRQESQAATHTQSIARATNKAADTVRDQLKPRFVQSGLTEFEQQAALQVIGEEVDAKLEANGLYQSIYDSILNEPASEAREKKLAKHVLTYTNQVIGKIAADVIRRAKGGTLQRQADKDARVSTQTAASKTEPQGSSVTPSSPQQLTDSQLRQQIVTEYKTAHGGEEPDRDYVMKEGWKRKFGGK